MSAVSLQGQCGPAPQPLRVLLLSLVVLSYHVCART